MDRVVRNVQRKKSGPAGVRLDEYVSQCLDSLRFDSKGRRSSRKHQAVKGEHTEKA